MKTSGSRSLGKQFPVCIILLLNFQNLFAQSPAIEWQNDTGGDLTDVPGFLIQTSDGGYFTGGYSDSDSIADKSENNIGAEETSDIWIMKLDSLGVVEWDETIGGSGDDILLSAIETPDGFLLGGTSGSGVSGDKTDSVLGEPIDEVLDYWVISIDPLGNIIWQKTIGGNYNDYLGEIIVTSDGGYLLAGSSDSDSSYHKSEGNIGSEDYWLVKLDLFGNIEWDETIGGTGDDLLQSLIQTSDGGYLIAGDSQSPAGYDKSEPQIGAWSCWIVKVNAVGDIEWENTIGGEGNNGVYGLAETPDGYVAAAYSTADSSVDKSENSYGDGDIWLYKLNDAGEIIWQHTIGGTETDVPIGIVSTNDNGFIIGAYSQSPIGYFKSEITLGFRDYWVVKTDSLGNVEWDKTLGGNSADYLQAITQTSDGGYALAGKSYSDNSGNKTEDNVDSDYYDFWIVKLEASCIDPALFFIDADADGFGSDSITKESCELPLGYVVNSLDCNDFNAAVFPGATEIENGIDDDCNDLIDDGIVPVTDIGFNISVYPNPANDYLFVDAPFNSIAYDIISITGHVILRGIANESSINVSSLPAGMYIARLYLSNKVVVLSFQHY